MRKTKNKTKQNKNSVKLGKNEEIWGEIGLPKISALLGMGAS